VQIAQLEQDEADAKRLLSFMGVEINLITGGLTPLPGAAVDSGGRGPLDSRTGSANQKAEAGMRGVVFNVLTLLSTGLLLLTALQMMMVDPVTGMREGFIATP
jgi:hypothetical protein